MIIIDWHYHTPGATIGYRIQTSCSSDKRTNRLYDSGKGRDKSCNEDFSYHPKALGCEPKNIY